MFAVAAAGAVSRYSTHTGRFPGPGQTIMKPPPPMLPAEGHVTANAKAVATQEDEGGEDGNRSSHSRRAKAPLHVVLHVPGLLDDPPMFWAVSLTVRNTSSLVMVIPLEPDTPASVII
jgi:hypothetical protein